MSKLPTRPATKTAPATSSTKEEPKLLKSDEEMKGPVQRYYGRAIRLAFQLKTLEEEFTHIFVREPQDSKFRVEVKSLLNAYAESRTAVHNTLGTLTTLHSKKWLPAKVSKGPSAGSLVTLKDFALQRFCKHGAYSAEELKDLKVISVHGPQVKLQTKKGDNLGLVSTGWVTRSEAA